MDPRRPKQLKSAAAFALRTVPGHWKLAFLYSAVAALVTLAVNALSLYLDSQVAGTGGIGGIGARSALETVESMVSLIADFLLPFWSIGYVSLALKLASMQGTADDLLDGFRRFGPVVRYQLLTGIASAAAMFMPMYMAIVFLLMTPLGMPVMEQMLPYLMEQNTLDMATMDDAAYEAIAQAGMPVFIGAFAFALLVVFILSYFVRMAPYLLMDQPQTGAFAAFFGSIRLMSRNIVSLVKLDLSFWWYHLAQWLIGMLPLCALLIKEPSLPVELIFLGVPLALSVGLTTLAGNHVEVTYAMAYRAYLEHQNVPSPQPAPEEPRDVPWNY